MAKQERSGSKAATFLETEPIDEAEYEEPVEVPKAKNGQCRYCKDDMELVGRLKGTEWMWIMNVAQQIVLELGTLRPVINEAIVRELLSQVHAS